VHSALAIAFQQLDSVLAASENLWRPQPFTDDNLPWSRTHRHLQEALLNLSDTQVLQLHDSCGQRVEWFGQMEPQLCAALYALAPPPTVAVAELAPDRFDSVHIPGRKWQQIVAFAAALPRSELPVVDWCAGKGHLSRIVQRSQQQPVRCLEWDAALVAAGEKLAQQQQRDIHYFHHDVMQALPAICADSASVHVGLHACGTLHHRLLQHAVTTSAQAVALSPCCYHKISTAHYQPLSVAARASQLQLDRSALHLAVQDTVTARAGERRMREKERWWRLGFDALQRELRSTDEYLNVPSCKRAVLREDFPGFCRWAANARQLTLPAHIDYEHYLQLARDRHRDILRLDLLRQLFNRPLELWLVLDCALYLEEHGYRVAVTQFCKRQLSPRNLLIQAEKIAAQAGVAS
jgi:Methyltransferase domain